MSLPPPALIVSAPPPPSIVSLPDPPVSVLADDVPVIAMPEEMPEALTFWKLDDVGRIARRLVGISEIDVRRARQHQRVGSGTAVDRCFGAVIGHGVGATAGIDHVGTAAAIDRIVARAGGDRIGARRSRHCHRRRDARRRQVLEIRHADAVAGGLVDAGGDREVDRRNAAERRNRKRVVAVTAVDRDLGAAIDDRIVPATGIDGVGAAGAVDRIRAGAADDRVRGGRAGQHQS